MKVHARWPVFANGSMLIETLVTLTLLTAALISISLLLSGSMRSLDASLQRLHAIRLTSDFAEVLQGISQHAPINQVSGTNHNCSESPCPVDKFISDSLYRWQEQTRHILPGGIATYQLDDIDNTHVAIIELSWLTGSGIENSHQISVPLAKWP